MPEDQLEIHTGDEAELVGVLEEEDMRAPLAGRRSKASSKLRRRDRRFELRVASGYDVRCVRLVGTVGVDELEACIGER
jgi:hypothetical protein